MIALMEIIIIIFCIALSLGLFIGYRINKEERLRLAKEASKLGRENFSLEKRCDHLTAKLCDEEEELEQEAEDSQWSEDDIRRMKARYNFINRLDDIAAVKQEAARCKEIDLNKAGFEAYLLMKGKI